VKNSTELSSMSARVSRNVYIVRLWYMSYYGTLLAHSLSPRSFSPSISTQKIRLSLQLLSVKVPRQADERGGGSKEDVASVN